MQDGISRSTTFVGDINGDSFDDLIVGKPLSSTCSVFLGSADSLLTDPGSIATAVESFRIVADGDGDGTGYFGWAMIKVGDLNRDGYADIVISAMGSNMIHFIYGRSTFPNVLFLSQLMLPRDGFRIIGSVKENTNFGVAMTSLHDFNRDGYRDIAITSLINMNMTNFLPENSIYILFLTPSLMNFINEWNGSLWMDRVSGEHYLKIISASYSFAGFSIAGIGDINDDGYDDLAIGSLPYNRGQYTEQKTYIIFGRSTKFLSDGNNLIDLDNLQSRDGFVITGGGFLVSGIGDVNGDGIHDVMITNYRDWSGQGNAYLIQSPKNMTAPPTFYPTSLPSSQPSAVPSTSAPSFPRTFSPTFNSSRAPSLSPSYRPSLEPTSVAPSIEPSRAVFVLSTNRPSRRPTRPPITRTIRPTRSLSTSPTIAASLSDDTADIFVKEYPEAGQYVGIPNRDNEYLLTGRGSYLLTGVLGRRNIYKIFPLRENIVIITNFQVNLDIIDLMAFKRIHLLKDLTFSTNPLTFLLSSIQQEKNPGSTPQQVILSSIDQFSLTKDNFYLAHSTSSSSSATAVGHGTVESEAIMIGSVFFAGMMICYFVYLTWRDGQDLKKQMIEDARHAVHRADPSNNSSSSSDDEDSDKGDNDDQEEGDDEERFDRVVSESYYPQEINHLPHPLPPIPSVGSSRSSSSSPISLAGFLSGSSDTPSQRTMNSMQSHRRGGKSSNSSSSGHSSSSSSSHSANDDEGDGDDFALLDQLHRPAQFGSTPSVDLLSFHVDSEEDSEMSLWDEVIEIASDEDGLGHDHASHSLFHANPSAEENV